MNERVRLFTDRSPASDKRPVMYLPFQTHVDVCLEGALGGLPKHTGKRRSCSPPIMPAAKRHGSRQAIKTRGQDRCDVCWPVGYYGGIHGWLAGCPYIISVIHHSHALAAVCLPWAVNARSTMET